MNRIRVIVAMCSIMIIAIGLFSIAINYGSSGIHSDKVIISKALSAEQMNAVFGGLSNRKCVTQPIKGCVGGSDIACEYHEIELVGGWDVWCTGGKVSSCKRDRKGCDEEQAGSTCTPEYPACPGKYTVTPCDPDFENKKCVYGDPAEFNCTGTYSSC